ncbi:MAG: carbon storage regulator [Dorea sp.]|nr:carbon storage regulator [Dorea sp.]
MLILRRKTGESLILNENIKITVLESGSDGVRLAIDAPKQVQILREELVEATKANQEAVAAVDKEKLEKLKGMLKAKKDV